MRKLVKTPSPKVLSDNHHAWHEQLKSAIKNTAEFSEIQSRYRKPAIRKALELETSYKCAYCESTIKAVSYTNIEHIHPKTDLLTGTFDWENLTISCQVCNTKKGTTVPTAHNFVHPYNGEPRENFSFAGPAVLAQPGKIAAVNMIRWLDLNRTDLVMNRISIFDRVREIFFFAEEIDAALRAEYLDLAIGDLVKADRPYTAMVVDVSEELKSIHGF